MPVAVNNIVAGGFSTVQLYTVATLPVATSVTSMSTAFVSDGLLPALAAAITGGGAVMTRVFSDGSIWRVG